MTRTLSQVTKVHHGSYPGSTRLDERPRNSLARSQIPIAPRPFVYDALQPGEIRLIEIDPSQDRSTPIRAKLLHQPLHYGTYEALSYAWGSDEPQAKIDVNGKPFTVSGSLLEALRALRKETTNRTLWIDSICINQNDREEREQTAQKSAILCHATGTFSWTWDKNIKKGVLDYKTRSSWLISGRTSSHPAWSSTLPELEGLESEQSIDGTECQLYFGGSPPPLTSSPGSPQTISASPSLVSNADSHFQPTSVDTLPFEFGSSGSWMDNMYDAGLPQLLPDEAMVDMANTSQRKRSRVTAFPDDQPSQCIRKAQQTQSISSAESNEKGSGIVFACPFQKSNPQKYHRCLKYTLNRIKDVKQHIYRQHTQPAYYCARCYQIFTSTEDRDGHSRLAECEKRDPPQFEGISEQQRNELKKSSPKKKPLDEQWFEVWDVIFPGRPRPQSASIGNYVEEMVPLLRSFWSEKKTEIISGVMDSRGGCAGVDSEVLAEIMGSVFDRFEAETTRSTQGTMIERNGTPEPPSTQESTLIGSDFCFDFGDKFDRQDLSQIAVPDFDTGCVLGLPNYYYSQSV